MLCHAHPCYLPRRLVTFETLITILTIENLNLTIETDTGQLVNSLVQTSADLLLRHWLQHWNVFCGGGWYAETGAFSLKMESEL